MGLGRSSLQIIVVAMALGVATACGGGAAAPTATVPATSSPAAAPAASPARPPLASPAASPSTVASSSVTPTAGTAEVAGESYEVQSGDTLATISQQFYGDPSQWRRIYDANKDTIGADPDKLKIGMKLTVPPKQ